MRNKRKITIKFIESKIINNKIFAKFFAEKYSEKINS